LDVVVWEGADDMDLSTVVNVVSGAAVVAGVGFAVVQLRQSSRQRRDAAAVAIVATVQTQEVRQAVRLVLALPHRVDPDVVAGDAALLEAALAVDSACEMWGAMVFEGVVDHQLLDRMVGGWVRGSWSRLSLWVETERAKLGNPNVGEWWQWLTEVLEEDPDPGKQLGAHIAYRGKKRRD
jgi:hypothetical protein